jgi:hypothetical protein
MEEVLPHSPFSRVTHAGRSSHGIAHVEGEGRAIDIDDEPAVAMRPVRAAGARLVYTKCPSNGTSSIARCRGGTAGHVIGSG